MAIKIKSTKDFKSNGVKVLVYGASGVGKTRLCATAPRPIILSAEEGLLSLAEEDVDYIKIKNVKDLDEAYNFVKKSEEYDTICLDSVSEIAELLLEELKPDFNDKRQAYGKMADAIQPMIRRFRDIQGKNVVFISKMDVKVDEESGSTSYEPLLPGRVIPLHLPYMFDEVFCMRMTPYKKGKESVSYLQTARDRQYTAKDRSGKLDMNEKCNLTDLFNKIKNGKEEKADS